MNRVKKVVGWLLATGLVFAAATLLAPRNGVAAVGAQVFVTNPSVPVNGTVDISGTPTVQVAPNQSVMISGTPTVQMAPNQSVMISGTPTVAVASNSSISVSNLPSEQVTRDKDNPALTPFQMQLCAAVAGPVINPCATQPDHFQVPAGQRAVIEYVSNVCQAGGSPNAVTITQVFLTNQVGSQGAVYGFPLGQANSNSFLISNQQTRIYADPGTFVTIGLGGVNFTGIQEFCQVSLSGYLVTP
jgi:hypothetical protein